MAATMRPTHPTSLPTYRHHPYHPSSSSSSSSSTQPRSIPSSSGSGPKWQVHAATSPNPSSLHITGVSPQAQHPNSALPPSPPRSNRDQSETPSSIGLGVAFGGSAGGKWWDEELPAPPASLSSILESFRRSGEGDRDLLLSILGAKKAEEERLTALIQTRLTILQARLSLHSAAASLAHTKSPNALPQPYLPTPDPSHANLSPQSAHSDRAPSPSYMLSPPNTTPNQASRSPAQPQASKSGVNKERPFIQLPPMQVGNNAQHLPSIRNVEGYSRARSQGREGEKKGCCPRDREANGGGSGRGSTSPRSVASEGSGGSSRNGLEMLLDAGIESERRASGERERDRE